MSTTDRQKSQTLRSCILVLGMHGSGTSTLAGILGNLGCSLPASAQNNSELESPRIHDFNDQLLASAGSSWDDVASFYDGWLQSPFAPEFRERAISLLEEEFGDARLFVLSDPRIARLVRFWREVLELSGCNPKPILVNRNPVEIGRSLRCERRTSEPLSQIVWLRHMVDAERETRGMTRFHTTFELLVRDWETVARKMQDELQLVWPKPTANAEFEVAQLLSDTARDLEQVPVQPKAGALLPDWLRETQEIFDAWAISGEKQSDCGRLDRIRAEFDLASGVFGRVIRAGRDSRVNQPSGSRLVRANGTGLPISPNGGESEKAMLQEQRRKTTLLNAELQQQIEAREAVESQLLEAQAELAASRERRKEMARVITNREAKISRLEEEVATRYRELAALQRQIVRSNPLWMARAAVRSVVRASRRPNQDAAPESKSLN